MGHAVTSQPIDEGGQSPAPHRHASGHASGPRAFINIFFSVGTLHTKFSPNGKLGFCLDVIAAFDSILST